MKKKKNYFMSFRSGILPPNPTHPLENYVPTLSKSLLDANNKFDAHEISFQHCSKQISSIEEIKDLEWQSTGLKPNEYLAKIYPCPSPQYCPEQVPPDFYQAKKHKLAHMVNPAHVIHSNDILCESTGIVIPTEKLKLDCKRSELFHLGPVIPMYLLLMKQICFIFGLLGLITASLNYRQVLSTASEPSSQDSRLVISVILIVVPLFLLMHLFRRKQKLTKLACKKSVITPSDYTIICSEMGKIHNEQEVCRFFRDNIVRNYSLDVNKVTITYNFEKYAHKIRKVKRLLEIEKEFINKSDSFETREALKMIRGNIEDINFWFNDNEKKLENLCGLKRNGLAFVTFNTKQEAKAARRKYEMSHFERLIIQLIQSLKGGFSQLFFKQHLVRVEKAPNLNEIIWEHLNCNVSPFNLINVLLLLLILFIMTSTGLVLYLIKVYRFTQGELLSGMFIMSMNELLRFMAFSIGLFERFKTITDLNITLGYRMTVILFLNTAIPLLIVNLFTMKPNFKNFSSEIFMVSLIPFFLPLLLRLINPKYLYKSCQRRRLLSQGSACSLNQSETNHNFEEPEFCIYRLYADCLWILLFSCFYFTVSPAISLTGFLATFLRYWVEKFTLLRRSLLPSNMRSEIAESMFEFLDFAIFLLAAGCLGFLSIRFTDNGVTAISTSRSVPFVVSAIVVLLSIINMILPQKRLNRYWNVKRIESITWVDELFYQQASEYFFADYSTANPVYRDKKVSENIREHYIKSNREFKPIELIHKLPELLPLFDYIVNRPSLYQIWRKNLTGLKNPYYIFPQNYGYGLHLHSEAYNGFFKSLLYTKSQRITESMMSIYGRQNIPDSMLVPKPLESKLSTKNHGGQRSKINLDVNGQSPINSVHGIELSDIKGWSVFLDQNKKSFDEDGRIDLKTPIETLSCIDGNQNGDNQNENQSDSQLSSVSLIKAPSIQRGLFPNLNPIQKPRNLMHKREESVSTPVFNMP